MTTQAVSHSTTLRNLQGMPEAAYTNVSRTMASLWAAWESLPLLEQFAVIADFNAMMADPVNDPYSYTELALKYRADIGPNLRAYAACMVLNLRAAYNL